MDDLVGGGAPLLGEPLPIELANATFAVRGRLQDGLRTPEHLAAWLRDVRHRLSVPLADADLRAVGDAELAMAREIRDCVRALAEATVSGRRPHAAALDTLNRHVRAAPRWQELHWADGPQAVTRASAPPVMSALAAVAEAAVGLFAGEQAGDLRACHGPGCVLYFVKDHPRREWCSAGCGNRARAARHYERAKRRSGEA